MATISFGPSNSLNLPIEHTNDITDAMYQLLGASRSNTEIVKDGSVYAGPLFEGDEVVLRTKANSKA